MSIPQRPRGQLPETSGELVMLYFDEADEKKYRPIGRISKKHQRRKLT